MTKRIEDLLKNAHPRSPVEEAEGELSSALHIAASLGEEWRHPVEHRFNNNLRQGVLDQLLHATIRVLSAISELEMRRRIQRQTEIDRATSDKRNEQ
jgi:hypothetical protein